MKLKVDIDEIKPQRCDLPFLQSDVFVFAIENVDDDDGLNVRKVGI